MVPLAHIYTTLVIIIVVMAIFTSEGVHARRQRSKTIQAAGRNCNGQMKQQQALQVTSYTNVIRLHRNGKIRNSKTAAVAIQAKCSDGSTLFTAKCKTDRRKFASVEPEMFLEVIAICESVFVPLLSGFIPDIASVEAELNSWQYSALNRPEEEILNIIHGIFFNSGMRSNFQIDQNTMNSFLAAVLDGYRPNPYRNWRHAVDVTHTL